MKGTLREVVSVSLKKLDVYRFLLTMILECGHTKTRRTQQLQSGGYEVKLPKFAKCKECASWKEKFKTQKTR